MAWARGLPEGRLKKKKPAAFSGQAFFVGVM